MKRLKVNFEEILRRRLKAIEKAEQILSPMIFENDEAWDCFNCEEYMQKEMKLLICKNCKFVKIGEENICPICGHSEFEKIEIKREPFCRYCGRKFRETDLRYPAYYNSDDDTFYCGCKGWD